MTYVCQSCEPNASIQYDVPCSICGRRAIAEVVEDVSVTGEKIGFIVEGDPTNPEGRRVVSHPAEGGTAESRIDADGSFQAKLAGPLALGRAAEPHVLKVLAKKLREGGSEVLIDTGFKDDRGEDGALIVDGDRFVIQIVTAPHAPQVWRDLRAHAESSFAGDRSTAVEIVRAAIVAKAPKAKGCVLALDLSHASALLAPTLVDDYVTKYGDPLSEYAFKAVWLVGITPRSTFQLRQRPSV